MKRIALIVLLLLSSAATASADGFYAGLVAYNTGDYAMAERHWRALAERQDAKAQSGLGFLYYKGLGVARDAFAAAHWFHRAADQGIVVAQMFLGTMYFRGDGVPRDYAMAHMWCELALGAGRADALACRERLSEIMTDAEREQAARLLVDWYDRHPGE